MMRVIFASLFACSAVLISAGAVGQAGDTPVRDTPIPIFCPVAGMRELIGSCCPTSYCSLKVKDRHTLEFKGGAKLQFCCAKCMAMYQKPMAYSAEISWRVVANHQYVATKQATQIKCPLCGGKTDPALVCDVAGIKVAFCTEDCRKKIATADVGTRVDLIFGERGEQGFGRGFVMTVPKK